MSSLLFFLTSVKTKVSSLLSPPNSWASQYLEMWENPDVVNKPPVLRSPDLTIIPSFWTFWGSFLGGGVCAGPPPFSGMPAVSTVLVGCLPLRVNLQRKLPVS